MEIQIKIREDKLATKGYREFIEALQACYNLHNVSAENIKWVEAERQNFDTGPQVIIDTGLRIPKLVVSLSPTSEGNLIAEDYNAPLLLRDVQRWGLLKNSLGKYELKRKGGVPEAEEMFQQPRTLVEIIEKTGLKINDTTPIIETIALLPISQKGEFETEFAPQLRFDGLSMLYKIGIISQDKLNMYSIMTNHVQRVDVEDINQKKQTQRWKANFIPDFSDIEKLIVPSSAGHFILMATPYREKPVIDRLESLGFADRLYDSDSGMKSFGFHSLGRTRGGTVGGVDVGAGRVTGNARIHVGDVEDLENNSAIYHILVLGFRPEAEFNAEIMRAVGNSLDRYVTKN